MIKKIYLKFFNLYIEYLIVINVGTKWFLKNHYFYAVEFLF